MDTYTLTAQTTGNNPQEITYTGTLPDIVAQIERDYGGEELSRFRRPRYGFLSDTRVFAAVALGISPNDVDLTPR